MLTHSLLDIYRKETEEELNQILAYWLEHTFDEEQGGFYGRIDNDNNVDKIAPKGAVLNSRILWAFTAAYRATKNEIYLQAAERAFNYIAVHFIDKEFGGVYWTVDYLGHPLDTKKQIYALAFALYGITEYLQCRESETARSLAMDLFNTIEKYSFDTKRGGYFEAFARDWKEMNDLRLSAKDANEKKTMNTHLHVLEAYTNLYRIWPDDLLKNSIAGLTRNFLEHFTDKTSGHLILFFDENWNPRPGPVSYGHDIEATWLLLEAAEAIQDEALIKSAKSNAIFITNAVIEGLDSDGGLWYEYDPIQKHLIKEKHSWPQAEAMVGFFNAWQITNNHRYLTLSYNSWNFTKKYIKDTAKGEWYWGVLEDHQPMLSNDKVGIWKCPYHNSRACMQIMQRTLAAAQ